jgi:CDP-glycerol glycerophosphotransferase
VRVDAGATVKPITSGSVARETAPLAATVPATVPSPSAGSMRSASTGQHPALLARVRPGTDDPYAVDDGRPVRADRLRARGATGARSGPATLRSEARPQCGLRRLGAEPIRVTVKVEQRLTVMIASHIAQQSGGGRRVHLSWTSPGATWAMGILRPLLAGLVAFTYRTLSSLPWRRRSICIYGWPDWEENSLVAAVALAAGLEEQVVLLAERPTVAAQCLKVLDASAVAKIRILPKSSLRALFAASFARVVLVTHGIFGSPPLYGKKLVINLWHGTGPKRTESSASRDRVPADIFVCNSPLWGRASAESLSDDRTVVASIGNPRERMLYQPGSDANLALLGLDPAKPIVVWMPTYRATNGIAGRRWTDSDALMATQSNDIGVMVDLAARSGVQLVVKPHPLDADRYCVPGMQTIATPAIWEAGMSLYQFLARADGLISDYSSVWTEYLGLDRPLLLYCPDISAYSDGRGFNEPLMTVVAPELIVAEARQSAAFFEAVGRGSDWQREVRGRVR